MVGDIEIRKVTQDVFLFVWFKDEVITKEPSSELCCIPGISPILINNLRISVWMQSKRIKFKYQSIISNFWERINSSPYVFANYVAYIFYIFCESPNAYAYFFDVFAFMAYFSVHCWQSECKQYINACVDLLCAFFEKEIRTKFENQGGWEHLNEYLEKIFALTKYRSLIEENKCPIEYYNSLQDNVHESEGNLKLTLNGADISNVTSIQVETDERSFNFAKSVKDKITELCTKELDEILSDFERTDHQVKDLYQKTLDATDELAREAVDDSSQEVQKSLQDTPNNPMCEEKEERRGSTAADLLPVQNPDDSQDVGASNITPKLYVSDATKGLLDQLSVGISKLNDIIHLLCEANGVKASVSKEAESKV